MTVAELRYGAIVAGWGATRRRRLEQAIDATTLVPVSDALITSVAELRASCRVVAHPLADPAHSNDLWIASTALHIETPLVTADGVFLGVPGLEGLE